MKSLRQHYHWIIVLVLLIELAVLSGILNNVISLHLIPVTQGLGISRGSFSLALSIRPLVGFFATLFSGVFLVKFGYRKLVSVSLLVAAVAFFLLGISQNVWMLAAAAAALGLGEAFCTTPSASRMVNTWFHSHQGMILGLVTASTGLGGSLFSVVLAEVIQKYSWRYSFFLSAILVGLTALLILLLAKDHPGQMSLQPFGTGMGHGKKPRRTSRDHWQGYEARDVFRQPAFYLMAVVVFLSCGCVYAVYSVIVPHLQDLGMGAAEAASIQSILLLSLAAAKFICGSLGDLLGARAITLLCMICCVIGVVLLTIASSFGIAVIAAVFFSVGVVLTTITVPLLSTALFGYRPQGSIVGVFMAMVPAASVIASPIVNTLYDRIGSYTPIFLFTAGFGSFVAGLMVLLFSLASRQRKRFESLQTCPH